MGAFHEGRVVAGRYEVLDRLGDGGVAQVFRAHDRVLDRDVAVKVLLPTAAGHPELLWRFRREAHALARLDHPGIVAVYDLVEDDGGPYLVLALVRGHSLAQVMRSGPLPWRSCAEIGAGVCDALAAAHAEGIVHRDITPANILIDDHGRPHVADFGIARLLEGTRATRSGVAVGTPAYMAPEQALGRTVDSAADQYGLSAVLFEAATGRPPYFGDSAESIQDMHVRAPVPDPSAFAPNLPPAATRILRRGLAKRPQDRFASVAGLGDALRESADAALPFGSGVKVAGFARTGRPPGRDGTGDRRRAGRVPRVGSGTRRALIVAAAAVALAVVGWFVGMSIAGTARGHGDRADSSDVSILLPQGWSAQAGLGSGLPGLALGGAVAATSRDGQRGEIVAGLTHATGPTLLPEPFRMAVSGPLPRPTAVLLGHRQALRYSQVRVRGLRQVVTLFTAPTNRGVATVACIAQPGTLASDCSTAASSLDVRGAMAFAVGPRQAYARASGSVLRRLNAARAKHRRVLGASRQANEQAEAAQALAADFGRAQRELAQIQVSPREAPAHRDLLAAIGGVRSTYTRLARAARTGDRAGFDTAASQVHASEAGLETPLRELAALGYRLSTPR